jgi:hypothetical protein
MGSSAPTDRARPGASPGRAISESCRAEQLDLPVAGRYLWLMKQNNLYLIIGVLVAAVIALGIYAYREETKPKGVELRIDETGISVQEK